MAKVIQFPLPSPEKFGFKPVRKKAPEEGEKQAQLNLFTGAKVVNLSKLSTFEQALMLDELGDKQAAELYQKAIAAGDSIADAYCNLGILESERRNHTKAIDCFTKSLKAEPRHFESHYNLANVYAEVGNYLLAKIHYQISIEIEPTFPNSHFNLGLTLAMNKETEDAIQSLTEYKRLVGPGDYSQADELIQSLSRIR